MTPQPHNEELREKLLDLYAFAFTDDGVDSEGEKIAQIKIVEEHITKTLQEERKKTAEEITKDLELEEKELTKLGFKFGGDGGSQRHFASGVISRLITNIKNKYA